MQEFELEEILTLLAPLQWTSRDFGRDKIIAPERSSAVDAIIVRHGVVCCQVAGDTGHRQIASLHFPGDLVNLESCYLGIATTTIQALSAATVAICPRAEFLAFIEQDEDAKRAAWIGALADAADARLMVANLARKSARARLANLLCRIAWRLDEQGFVKTGHFQQPLSQKQLGDATSLTSIHVNRVLRSLDEEGLLTRSGADFCVPDRRALADLGSFYPEEQQRLRHEASALLVLANPGHAAQQEARRA